MGSHWFDERWLGFDVVAWSVTRRSVAAATVDVTLGQCDMNTALPASESVVYRTLRWADSVKVDRYSVSAHGNFSAYSGVAGSAKASHPVRPP
jgi:hypothetical protein